MNSKEVKTLNLIEIKLLHHLKDLADETEKTILELERKENFYRLKFYKSYQFKKMTSILHSLELLEFDGRLDANNKFNQYMDSFYEGLEKEIRSEDPEENDPDFPDKEIIF